MRRSHRFSTSATLGLATLVTLAVSCGGSSPDANSSAAVGTNPLGTVPADSESINTTTSAPIPAPSTAEIATTTLAATTEVPLTLDETQAYAFDRAGVDFYEMGAEDVWYCGDDLISKTFPIVDGYWANYETEQEGDGTIPALVGRLFATQDDAEQWVQAAQRAFDCPTTRSGGIIENATRLDIPGSSFAMERNIFDPTYGERYPPFTSALLLAGDFVLTVTGHQSWVVDQVDVFAPGATAPPLTQTDPSTPTPASYVEITREIVTSGGFPLTISVTTGQPSGSIKQSQFTVGEATWNASLSWDLSWTNNANQTFRATKFSDGTADADPVLLWQPESGEGSCRSSYGVADAEVDGVEFCYTTLSSGHFGSETAAGQTRKISQDSSGGSGLTNEEGAERALTALQDAVIAIDINGQHLQISEGVCYADTGKTFDPPLQLVVVRGQLGSSPECNTPAPATTGSTDSSASTSLPEPAGSGPESLTLCARSLGIVTFPARLLEATSGASVSVVVVDDRLQGLDDGLCDVTAMEGAPVREARDGRIYVPYLRGAGCLVEAVPGSDAPVGVTVGTKTGLWAQDLYSDRGLVEYTSSADVEAAVSAGDLAAMYVEETGISGLTNMGFTVTDCPPAPEAPIFVFLDTSSDLAATVEIALDPLIASNEVLEYLSDTP